MTKLKQLVAATDLSAPARHAVERAALLSQQTGASLDVLHVANLAPLERLRQLMMQTPEALQHRVLDAAREKLAGLAQALRERYGVSAQTHVVSGSLLEELARASDAVAADLIVCGGRGENFMRHLVLGSTPERMIGHTKRPILVVKQAAHAPYRKLLVPVDFSPSSLPAIRAARLIAPQAQIALLHAFEVPFESSLRYASVDDKTIHRYRDIARQEAVQQLYALSEEARLPASAVQCIVVHGVPSLLIVEQEQEINCDLIVMGKHGDNPFEEFFIGSVTKRVLAHAQSDVLVSP
jgi:nucleotide-binding universal stress UspA family protein